MQKNDRACESLEFLRAELTRLTEIAEGVDPLVVRLHDVTEKLERANALLRQAHPFVPITYSSTGQPQLHARIQAHLSENGHD